MEIFYVKNGQKIGPIEIDEIQVGEILPKTLVWKAGLDEWVEARRLDALKDYFNRLVTHLESTPPPIPTQQERRLQAKYDLKDTNDYSGEYLFGALVMVGSIIAVTMLPVVDNTMYSESEEFLKIKRYWTIFGLILFAFRIVSSVLCYKMAEKKNRDVNWAFLGFLLSGLAVIILASLKKLKGSNTSSTERDGKSFVVGEKVRFRKGLTIDNNFKYVNGRILRLEDDSVLIVHGITEWENYKNFEGVRVSKEKVFKGWNLESQ